LFDDVSHKSAWPLEGGAVRLSTAIEVKPTLLEVTEAMLPSTLDIGLISLGLILVVIYRCLLFF
jgi:hypothetical protein